MGAFLAAPLMERSGRKKTFLLAYFLLCAPGSFLQLFAPNLGALVAGRFWNCKYQFLVVMTTQANGRQILVSVCLPPRHHYICQNLSRHISVAERLASASQASQLSELSPPQLSGLQQSSRMTDRTRFHLAFKQHVQCCSASSHYSAQSLRSGNFSMISTSRPGAH